jgi:hypothetical protein
VSQEGSWAESSAYCIEFSGISVSDRITGHMDGLIKEVMQITTEHDDDDMDGSQNVGSLAIDSQTKLLKHISDVL